jgi:hypothetical protein
MARSRTGKGAGGVWWSNLRAGERRDPAAGLGDLEAALAVDACPICTRTAGADERWLDHFLYEGYLEPEAMQPFLRAGGPCAYHARRVAAIGLSATVGLIYLRLIQECLPSLERQAAAGERSGPLIAALGSCPACEQARHVERRECFFLALLLGARGAECYGRAAVVCMRHLPPLAGHLEPDPLEGVLAAHLRTVTALRTALAEPPLPCRGRPEVPEDRALRIILGPPARHQTPAANHADAVFAGDPDPVRRLRRRLRRLPSCAVCAEIDDAAGQWLRWLAQQAESDGDLADVLPLCSDHVWQARAAGGPMLGQLLAEVTLQEAEERLVYAERAFRIARESSSFRQAFRRLWPGSVAGDAVQAALVRGRVCPLCRRLREAADRAVALLVSLLEDTAGRRAFEHGYGLCVRHSAQFLGMREARPVGAVVASTLHARLALLGWELEEQLRRGAWQARPETRGTESSAWLRAPPRFAGSVNMGG